jgi:leucyl/phenylalanyl-tRNA--protein transferase
VAHIFPAPHLAEPNGLLAVGGDLHPDRLLLGYTMGIFPWYSDGQPILWHAPDPRFVLFPDELRISRSLRKTMRRRRFRVTLDEDFEQVIRCCAESERPDQEGTWITAEMEEGYRRLHHLGHAHSVEAWLEGELVGGLYGVALGDIFFGESMFAKVSDASKVAFATLVSQLTEWGFKLLDSQVRTDHLATFGARDIPRHSYTALLRRCLGGPDRRGPWRFDEELLSE